jgi:glycosyltransferase involved in cell wall biosynthesis
MVDIDKAYSVILTVKNEQQSIKSFFEFFNRGKSKSELIVVDGGSTDKTYSILQSYAKKYKYIRVFQKKGNISVGRNYAIRKARGSIIVQTDAGCMPSPHWFEEITKPFRDKSVQCVAGFYTMTYKSAFQEACGLYFGVHPKRYDAKTFLPSGRSIAFRKTVWKLVGGYDESLTDAGEDTLWNYSLIRLGIPIYRASSATVEWSPPSTLVSAAKKFFRYAKGDAETMIFYNPGQKFSTHFIKILSIYFRYIFLFTLFLILPQYLFYIRSSFFVVYGFFSLYKHRNLYSSWRVGVWIVVLQYISDFSVMLGYLTGIINRFYV